MNWLYRDDINKTLEFLQKGIFALQSVDISKRKCFNWIKTYLVSSILHERKRFSLKVLPKAIN